MALNSIAMKAKPGIYFAVILSIVISVQCRKDKLEPEKECITHENLTNGFGQPIFISERPHYDMPYFNPTNSEEIIYRYGGVVNPEFDLIKYNLTTKEKKVIYQGFFANRPSWGRNGWILLNVLDSLGYNIYKIRDDGSELTPLTTSGNCFNPEWDINSEKFIYQFAFQTPSKNILADVDGAFIDTLPCGGAAGRSWQHSIYMAGSSFRGFAYYNPLQCEDQYFFELENIAQSLNGAEWLDEERVFWCHTTGIYVTNIVTKETEMIRETCNARCYQRPTYAPDIDKIIVEKFERILITETSGTAILSFAMMNPDGTEEEVIQID